MAVAVYATDLSDITLAETGTFVELTNWTAGTPSTGFEGDYFIQGTTCKSSTVKTTQSSLAFDYGSGITVPTDGAVLVWQTLMAPNSLDSYVNGGMRVAIGSSSSAFNMWYTGGLDRYPNPYGGWVNSAVNPTISADATEGSPSGTLQVFGTCILTPTTYPSKGAPMGLDAIRYGRCEMRVNAGDSGTPGNFTDMAAKNDANDATNGYNRWGLFSNQGGSFFNKGLITFGYGSAVYFVDANKVVNIEDTPKVTANFNTWSIENASSVFYLTSCVLQSLGTVSPGRVIMVDAADLQFLSCLIKDWGTFVFLSTAVLDGTTFLRCKTIDSGGGSFIGAKIITPNVVADSYGLLWNNASNPGTNTTGMYFSKGTNAHHAIAFGTSAPLTINLNNITFVGFNASDGQNDSTLYFPDTGSDVTWTINASGCTGNISYKKARTGDTVTINLDQIDLVLKNLAAGTEVTVVRQSDSTVLFHEESSSGDVTYTYDSDAGTLVDVLIFHVSYDIDVSNLLNYTLPAVTTSIPITQIIDINYNNS